jgi:hypothetical protein
MVAIAWVIQRVIAYGEHPEDNREPFSEENLWGFGVTSSWGLFESCSSYLPLDFLDFVCIADSRVFWAFLGYATGPILS